MLLKNNSGFSIWIYVFGFSRCNGLITKYINNECALSCVVAKIGLELALKLHNKV